MVLEPLWYILFVSDLISQKLGIDGVALQIFRFLAEEEIGNLSLKRLRLTCSRFRVLIDTHFLIQKYSMGATEPMDIYLEPHIKLHFAQFPRIQSLELADHYLDAIKPLLDLLPPNLERLCLP